MNDIESLVLKRLLKWQACITGIPQCMFHPWNSYVVQNKSSPAAYQSSAGLWLPVDFM